MIMNKACQIAGIKLLLSKNYKLQTDTIDLFSLVDSSISYIENWNNIKDKYLSNKFCPYCGKYHG